MKLARILFYPGLARYDDCALLLLRVICGIAFMFHGWGKIQDPFDWMGPNAFAPGFLQGLAALAEFGGGLAWVLGLLTQLASFGIMSTMIVAVYLHAVMRGDPFVAAQGGPSYEPAAVFLAVAILLLVRGPGRFAIDALLKRKNIQTL